MMVTVEIEKEERKKGERPAKQNKASLYNSYLHSHRQVN
jgi:hypothetical protein